MTQKTPNICMAGFAALLLLFTMPAAFAQVPFFSDSGVKDIGNPQALGGVNNTGQSVAFELIFDFTSAVDAETDPIVLWELGATGSGSALVLDDDNLFYWAGNSVNHFVTGAHGLSPLQEDVQIVSVFEVGAGANGTDELLSLYVNGNLIDDGDFNTANIWAGSDPGGIGSIRGGAGARFSGSTDIDSANVVNYPTDDISLSVYQLASSGGDPSNTLDNILVPEPSTFVLIGLGLAVLGVRQLRRA